MDHSKGYYILTKNSNNVQPYHWVLNAPNHKVILTSETYSSRDAALNGIESVRENSPFDEQYERLIAKDDSPYFNLLAKNGKIIGTSEMYSSQQKMEVGIAAVKKYGKGAVLVDETGTADGTGKPVTTNRPERSKSNRYA